MAIEPTSVSRDTKHSIRVFAGLSLAIMVLMSLLFPKMLFADQTSDTHPTEQTSRDDNNIPSEQELIEALMEDVAISAKPQGQENWEYVRMRVTGYCPCEKCCGTFSDGITANNHRIKPGDKFVAADKRYPFGTQMLIPGYNGDRPVKVMDRGGAIKGNRLDLFFHTHQAALQWGVQYLDVLMKTK